MGRLGNTDPEEVLALARACDADPSLELAGVWTHFATADEPDSAFFDEQLGRFEAVAAAVKAEFPAAIAHAANSAAVFREPRSHFDMARCGVAIYGLDPFQGDPAERGLAPALSLRSYVADVKRFARRRQRRLRPPLDGAEPRPGSASSRSATATASAAASATTPRSWSAAAGTRWSARSRWTTSRSTSAPRPRSSRATRRC